MYPRTAPRRRGAPPVAPGGARGSPPDGWCDGSPCKLSRLAEWPPLRAAHWESPGPTDTPLPAAATVCRPRPAAPAPQSAAPLDIQYVAECSAQRHDAAGVAAARRNGAAHWGCPCPPRRRRDHHRSVAALRPLCCAGCCCSASVILLSCWWAPPWVARPYGRGWLPLSVGQPRRSPWSPRRTFGSP